ncbi:MAG TPA: hypothetical protein VFF06_36150 [Polyangia bacterium]|nr:hypothetical protein [Polyangia bacterium]
MARLAIIVALALALPLAARAEPQPNGFMPHVPSYFLSMSIAGVRDKLLAPGQLPAASVSAGGSCNVSNHGPGHSAAAVLMIVGGVILIVARRRWS